MSQNLQVALISLVVLIGTAGIVGVVRLDSDRAERPIPATARTLDADFELYHGALVRLPTDGFERSTPNQMQFRKRTDQPPIVVLVFARAAPDDVKFVVGRVTARQGASVVVEQCRPD